MLRLRFILDGLRNGMGLSVFGGGGVGQNVLLGIARTRIDSADLWPSLSQSPRFIEDDGIDLVEQLEGAAVFNKDAALRSEIEEL